MRQRRHVSNKIHESRRQGKIVDARQLSFNRERRAFFMGEVGSSILETTVRKVVGSEKGEYQGVAQKCSCGSVWCPSCFVRKHAPGHMERLRSFNWKRTRTVVLPVDRKVFVNGRGAWEWVTRKKAIHGFVRNIQRGNKAMGFKPLKVRRWKWFLEWHKDGFPHWHLFLEMEDEGKAGMISNARIRHYWRLARWIHEDPIKSEQHWKHQTGYFQKAGYFEKGEGYQGRLPAWALDVPGLKIRRSCSSVERTDEPAVPRVESKPRSLGGVAVDPDTGEVHELPGNEKLVTYRVRLESCGQCTRVRVYGKNSYVEGVFCVPYSDLKKVVPGVYKEGQGYEFEMTEKLLSDLFEMVRSVQVKRGGLDEVLKHFRRTELRAF
jgi:hypothetical protein